MGELGNAFVLLVSCSSIPIVPLMVLMPQANAVPADAESVIRANES